MDAHVCFSRVYNESCVEPLPLQRGPVLCCTLDNIPLIRSVSPPLRVLQVDFNFHAKLLLLFAYLLNSWFLVTFGNFKEQNGCTLQSFLPYPSLNHKEEAD